MCVQGIRNCTNLRECTWTRDGSLKDEILEELSRCPQLQAVEINGHHNWNYSPELLQRLTRLRKFSVIMPSAEVVQALPAFLEGNSQSLESLTIICKVGRL